MEDLTQNIVIMIGLSVLFGYLVGSISFARLITYFVTKSFKVKEINEPVPGTDITFSSDSISATAVNINLGKKKGCLVSILDMTKVAIPTLLFRLLFPEEPYFLLVAAAGIAGHNYPVYHRFQGGRGESPIIGALLVINWFGILIANVAGMILGYLVGSVLVMRYGWYFLTIFWYWIFFNDIYYVLFAVVANFIFWNALRVELYKYYKLEKEQNLDASEEAVSEFLLMGKGLGRFIDNYGFPALIKKILKKS